MRHFRDQRDDKNYFRKTLECVHSLCDHFNFLSLALSSDQTSPGALFHISVAFVCVVFPAHDRWSGATTFPDDWPRVTGPSWVCFWNCFRLFQASIIIAFSDIFSTDAMPIVDRISDIGHSPYLGSPTTARTPAFDARCIFNFCSAFKCGKYAAALLFNMPPHQASYKIRRSFWLKCRPSLLILDRKGWDESRD